MDRPHEKEVQEEECCTKHNEKIEELKNVIDEVKMEREMLLSQVNQLHHEQELERDAIICSLNNEKALLEAKVQALTAVKQVESENQLATDYVMPAMAVPQIITCSEECEEVEDLVEIAQEEDASPVSNAVYNEEEPKSQQQPGGQEGCQSAEVANLKARLAQALEQLREQKDQTEAQVAIEVAKFKTQYEETQAAKIQAIKEEKDKEYEDMLASVREEQNHLVEQFQAIAADSQAKQELYEQQTALLRSQMEERNKEPVAAMFMKAACLLQDVKKLSETAELESKADAENEIESVKEELYLMEQQKDEEINKLTEINEKMRLENLQIRQRSLARFMEGDYFGFQRRCWLRAAWQTWHLLTRFARQQKKRKKEKASIEHLPFPNDPDCQALRCDEDARSRERSLSGPQTQKLRRVHSIEFTDSPERHSTSSEPRNATMRRFSLDLASMAKLSNWLQELIDHKKEEGDPSLVSLDYSDEDLITWRSALDALLLDIECYRRKVESLNSELNTVSAQAEEQRAEISRLQLRKSKYAHGMASQLDEEIRLRESLVSSFKEKEKQMEEADADKTMLIDCLKSEIKGMKEVLKEKSSVQGASTEITKLSEKLNAEVALRVSESLEWDHQKDVLRSMLSASQGKVAEANKIIESMQGKRKTGIGSLFRKKGSESNLKIGHYVSLPKVEDSKPKVDQDFIEPTVFTKDSPYDSFDWKVDGSGEKLIDENNGNGEEAQHDRDEATSTLESEDSKGVQKKASIISQMVSGDWSLNLFGSKSRVEDHSDLKNDDSGGKGTEELKDAVEHEEKASLSDGIAEQMAKPEREEYKAGMTGDVGQHGDLAEWKEFERQHSKSSMASSLDGQEKAAAATEWMEVLVAEPTPPFGIDSPVIDNLLVNWSEDRDKVDYMKLWLICTMENRPRPADMPPNVQLLSISPEVKDGFLMLVYPLLKSKRNIVAFTRQRKPHRWDLRLKLKAETVTQPNSKPLLGQDLFSSSLLVDLEKEIRANEEDQSTIYTVGSDQPCTDKDIPDAKMENDAVNAVEEDLIVALNPKTHKLTSNNLLAYSQDRQNEIIHHEQTQERDQQDISSCIEQDNDSEPLSDSISEKSSDRAELLEKKLARLRVGGF